MEKATHVIQTLFDSLNDAVQGLNEREKEQVNELLLTIVDSELEYAMSLGVFLRNRKTLINACSELVASYEKG